MRYPGKIIAKGSQDKEPVKAIQNKLNEKGCGPIPVDGHFDTKTINAVKLFQSRFTDQTGYPLTVDGKVGVLTWATLFGTDYVIPPNELLSGLSLSALHTAQSQIGVLENPLGSNSGPQVDLYLKRVGLNPGYAWCMAFVYYCFDEAAKNSGQSNPLIKTAGVIAHWNAAKCVKIPVKNAVQNPALIKPGQIFIISSGGGKGHTGLVEKVEGGILTTIEGNTNDGGSREGIGVFRRTARKVNSINVGFLQY